MQCPKFSSRVFNLKHYLPGLLWSHSECLMCSVCVQFLPSYLHNGGIHAWLCIMISDNPSVGQRYWEAPCYSLMNQSVIIYCVAQWIHTHSHLFYMEVNEQSPHVKSLKFTFSFRNTYSEWICLNHQSRCRLKVRSEFPQLEYLSSQVFFNL